MPLPDPTKPAHREPIHPEDNTAESHHPILKQARREHRWMTDPEQTTYWADLGWYRDDDGLLKSLTDGHTSPLQPPEQFIPPLSDGTRPPPKPAAPLPQPQLLTTLNQQITPQPPSITDFNS